jgi:3D (Asp-Asp-Asp) domain-containing protein
MALAADREVEFFTTQELVDLPVDDDVVIYKGALVGLNSTTGFARPLVAGDLFLGIAYRKADNTVTGHTAGGIRIRLHQSVDVVHTLTGVVDTDLGSVVYASGDDTLTLTQSSNSRVGVVIGKPAANTARVRIQPWQA